MNYFVSVIVSCFFVISSFSQHDAAFQLYNKKGKKVKYKKMIKVLAENDVVLFGELHDNPIAHWMQLQVTRSLSASREIILGAEMFEADNQAVLNDYLNGVIDEKALDSLARLWVNYPTDYAPLVEWAKSESVPFIATNVPRTYASLVYKKGFEALDVLPADEKQWIAPLPIPYDANLSQYQAMLEMMGGHGGENFPKAQAIKDATMAHFIVSAWKENTTFIHFNGSFHSNYFEGIYWYLQQYKPGINVATINTVLVEDINSLDKTELETADFILAVDHEMTSTYK